MYDDNGAIDVTELARSQVGRQAAECAVAFVHLDY